MADEIPVAWPELQPSLSDDVVRLRPFGIDDARWVYGACQDAAIQRWTRVPVPYLLSDAEGFVDTFATGRWDTGRGAHFAIEDVQGDCTIGCVGLDVIDEVSGVAVAGYWTAPEARGTGLTTRALVLLSAWALGSGRLVRLELHIDSQNASSRRVAELAGYNLEGVMVKAKLMHGSHRDIALYALTS